MQTLIIDHYDSFTYNLFQMIAEIHGIDPIVLPHDSPALAKLQPQDYDNIVLSPGPGRPDLSRDFALSTSFILHTDKPILGVCLGHQGIFSTFGGKISHAPVPMHGRTSLINHNGDELYQNIPTTFRVMRYHSLLCTGEVPDELEITAWTSEGLIMGLRHKHRPIWGIQYHPESIRGEYGKQLLQNFMALSAQHLRSVPRYKPVLKPALPPQKINKPVTHWNMHIKTCATHQDPSDIFQHLFEHQPTAVWLDSSQIIPGISRFSYMGVPLGPWSYELRYDTSSQTTTLLRENNKETYTMSIFSYLKHVLETNHIVADPRVPFPFHGGFIGYLGYELNQETAPIHQAKRSPYPDAHWVFLDKFIVLDHVEQQCYIVMIAPQEHTDLDTDWLETMLQQIQAVTPAKPPVSSASHREIEGKWVQDPETYKASIQQCLDFITAGESYEICLTNQLQFSQSIDPFQFYVRLRQTQPAPHAAYFKLGDLAIACSSMERFLSVDKHRVIQAKPIKGTTGRGKTAHEDHALAAALREDEKFQAEHIMIVDLLRNDLGKLCQVGSISVPELMQVETYATVHQLVSSIIGKLRPEIDAIDCIQHVFPGGSMTGAPKIRAMNLINQLETQARGIYSGSLGYISLNGTLDLNIVIRTAVITPNKISIGAGGAIIALSDPNEEFAEIVLKTRALRTALNKV